jgi:hypothetical protein
MEAYFIVNRRGMEVNLLVKCELMYYHIYQQW